LPLNEGVISAPSLNNHRRAPIANSNQPPLAAGVSDL
jgi:hypothetical protein